MHQETGVWGHNLGQAHPILSYYSLRGVVICSWSSDSGTGARVGDAQRHL